MSAVLSFAEVEGQRLELLPARIVLGVLDVFNTGDGNGGGGGDPIQSTNTEGGGTGADGTGGGDLQSNTNQDADGGAGTGGAIDALNGMSVQPLCLLLCG